MITKIEISNINSIRECKIDFAKAKYQYKNEMIFNNEIVNPVSFYGSNGSGKSSFLTAIASLVSLLIYDASDLHPFVPNFKNEKQSDGIAIGGKGYSSIKIFFTLHDKKYVYYMSTSVRGYIHSESLLQDKNVVFKRKKNTYTYNEDDHEISSSMFPTLRTLSIETTDPVIHACYNFLSNIVFIDANKRHFESKIALQKSYKDIIVEKSKEIKNILANYNEFPIYDTFAQTNKYGKKEYFAAIKHEEGVLVVPWDFLSTGMINQSLLLSFALSLPENGVLIIDEIEDALHPMTVLDFINVVKSKNIQLIFSSHNTHILQSLRPDQIFFATWKSGYSKYKRLSNIYPNIREINNIEKMYLSNMFKEDIENE